MSSNPSVVVDFHADYIAYLRQRLDGMGVPVPADATTVQTLSHIFWNAYKRLIAQRPRSVHMAKEFQMPPAKSDGDGVRALLEKFSRGIDVTPHLSKFSRQPKPFQTNGRRTPADLFHDPLLNDWGINHFHLNDAPDRDGFTKRTSLLLFAMVKPADVYVIDVLPHGSWARREMLERIHRNWPSLLSEYQQPQSDSKRAPFLLSDEEIATLRRKGGSTIFTAEDGTEYFPPGGGQVFAGIGLDVVMWTNRAAGVISHWNAWLKENPERVADTLHRAGRGVPEVVTLKLEIDEQNDLHAFEEALRVRMRLGPMFPPSS